MSSDSNRKNPTPGSDEALQEAIDATAAAYAGDSGLDVDSNFRAELTSRGLDTNEDAWIGDVVEDIRRGRTPVVGEHDGSVDADDG